MRVYEYALLLSKLYILVHVVCTILPSFFAIKQEKIPREKYHLSSLKRVLSVSDNFDGALANPWISGKWLQADLITYFPKVSCSTIIVVF